MVADKDGLREIGENFSLFKTIQGIISHIDTAFWKNPLGYSKQCRRPTLNLDNTSPILSKNVKQTKSC